VVTLREVKYLVGIRLLVIPQDQVMEDHQELIQIQEDLGDILLLLHLLLDQVHTLE